MQLLLNLKHTCDCSLLFNGDSTLLLLVAVVYSFWKIEEYGEAMEFLYSLDVAAFAFSAGILP